MPSLGELRAFVVVAEELHFTRAARRLGLAPPSLSQTIRRLEASLGAVLMQRTPRTVRLTEAGAELLPRARDILARVEEVQTALGPVAASGTFTVGIASNGFAEITAPIMQAFRHAHPGVRLVLRDITQDRAALVSHAVDVALVRPPIPEQWDARVRLTEVVDEPRVALLSADHRLAGAEAVSIAELRDERFVEVGPGMDPVIDYWAATDSLGGVRPRMGSGAFTVSDVLRGVVYLDEVITSIPSVLRFYHVPGIVGVPLVDVPPATMGVLTRADDQRPTTVDFCETVRRVAAGALELVPGARLLPMAS
jgi:DNA-binding transcriptional LysR family regulator